MPEKFIFRPLDGLWIIGQKFGENLACIPNAGVGKVIACNGKNPPEGYRSIYGPAGHNGWDCYAVNGQKLFAGIDGVIEELIREATRGFGLGVITNEKYFCIETGKEEYFKVRYWHLKEMNVKLGQSVEIGDLIGWCNNTGYSAGDHLHMEIKPVAKNSRGDWYNILQDNGAFGAVDPTPYFDILEATEFKRRRDVFRMAEKLSVNESMKPFIFKILESLSSLFAR